MSECADLDQDETIRFLRLILKRSASIGLEFA